jgi:hypothetical protein
VSLLLALLAAAPAPPAPPDITFRGGALAGLRMTVPSVPPARLKPSLPNASPLPPEDARAVSGLLSAYRSRRPADFAPYVSPIASSAICEDLSESHCRSIGRFTRFPFAERCVPNTPYSLGGHVARVEWLCGGELSYVTWLTLDGDKAVAASTRRVVPLVLIAPPSPAGGGL